MMIYSRRGVKRVHKRNNSVMPNLNFIKKHGIEKFVGQQKKRIELFKTMIESFDDGRSRSFFL
jgi:hypothetical protein